MNSEINALELSAMARCEAQLGAVLKTRGASKDYTDSGVCNHHWFRLVWRGGWQYVSTDEGRRFRFLAKAERRTAMYGDVCVGELCCSYDLGKGVDWVGIRVPKAWVECPFVAKGDTLLITLPDGSVIERPNPRA